MSQSSQSSNSNQSSTKLKWEPLIAGIAGGVASTVAVHPLDLVKVRFQVDEGTGIVSTRPKYQGMIHALKTIYHNGGGFTAWFQGLTPNVWGAATSWGLYFLIYNEIKARMQRRVQEKTNAPNLLPLAPWQHMLAAAQGGAMTLCVTNPIWVAKTRLLLQYERGQMKRGIITKNERAYRGMFHTIYQVAQHEGLRGLYKGMLPGLFGVSHGALQFMSYEEMKKFYFAFYQISENDGIGVIANSTFAALSKFFAASATYPYQVVRTRLQDQHRQYRGVWDVITQTWRYEGFVGFYKGIVPNLIRVVPASCITFVVYEKSMFFMKKFRGQSIV